MKRTLVVGEGPHEIGTTDEGLLHALAGRLAPAAFAFTGKLAWKNVKKTLPRGLSKDAGVVRALAEFLEAGEFDAVVFSRNRDNDEEREAAIEREFESLTSPGNPERVRGLSGAVSVECVESWGLALAGLHSRPDSLTKASVQKLAEQHGVDRYPALMRVAEAADLAEARTRSPSLDLFCRRVTAVAQDSE